VRLSRLREVRRKPLLVALAAVALALSAAACEPSHDGVATDTVRRATVTEVVDVPASVTARAVATLTAPADGVLTSLAVQPGSTVAKGAVVAVVDSPTARKRMADAKAALSAASSGGGGIRAVDLSSVQRNTDTAAAKAFDQARTAAGQVTDAGVRAALLAQVDAAQKQYDSAAQTARALARQVQQGVASLGSAVSALGAAQRAQAQAAYDLAASTVDNLTLRAPIAGVVQFAAPAASAAADPLASLLGSATGGSAAVPGTGGSGSSSVAGVDDVLSVGDQVSAGSAVVSIVDVSEIGLVGQVDETDVLLVSPGVTASVDLDAAPGVDFEATVGTVDLLPTQSAQGGVAYKVRLSFTAPPAGAGDAVPPPTPRPGMSAVAHLRVRTATDAISVPAAAVFSTDGGGEAVWLVRDGKAVQQAVKLGVQGEDLIQIASGVTPGQTIVVSGADQVTAGESL
jgi:HlyD family secretion protein